MMFLPDELYQTIASYLPYDRPDVVTMDQILKLFNIPAVDWYANMVSQVLPKDGEVNDNVIVENAVMTNNIDVLEWLVEMGMDMEDTVMYDGYDDDLADHITGGYPKPQDILDKGFVTAVNLGFMDICKWFQNRFELDREYLDQYVDVASRCGKLAIVRWLLDDMEVWEEKDGKDEKDDMFRMCKYTINNAMLWMFSVSSHNIELCEWVKNTREIPNTPGVYQQMVKYPEQFLDWFLTNAYDQVDMRVLKSAMEDGNQQFLQKLYDAWGLVVDDIIPYIDDEKTNTRALEWILVTFPDLDIEHRKMIKEKIRL